MAGVAAPSLLASVVRPTPLRQRLKLLAVGAALAAWTVLVVADTANELDSLNGVGDFLRYAGPIVAALVVLLPPAHSSSTARLVLGWTLTVSAAVLFLERGGTDFKYALIPAALVGGAACARRWPLQTLVAAGLVGGFYNTINQYAYLPTGPLIDLFIVSSWLALGYTWLTDRQRLPAGINAALLLFGLYLVATLVAALATEDLTRSLYSFRSSAWLMTLVFLIPLWASDESKRRFVHRAVLCLGFVVGVYAMVRWAIGPADKEAQVAQGGVGYVTNDLGELRLIGGFQAPQEMAVWSASMFAFALASALSPIGAAWRLVAVAVAGMSGAAIFAADVRFGMVAAAAAAVVVVVLFALGRGFAGRRALPLATVVVIAAIGGGVFITTKLSGEGSSGERFRSLVTDPIGDYSVQQRLVKWRGLLADVDDRPFGRGLGSSGAAEVKYARYTTDASFDPDSSYIKVAYDQGFVVLVLFAAALLVLLVALALVAVDTLNPLAGGRALASCGALTAFAITLAGGVYFEGLAAVGPWLLIGVGCTCFVVQRNERRSAKPLHA